MTQTISIRNFRWDDLDDVVAVMNATAESFNDMRRYNTEELRFDLQDPIEQPEQNYFVATVPDPERPDGRIVGMSECVFQTEYHQGWGLCYILPAYRGRGIGTRLFELTEMRLMAMLPDEREIDGEEVVFKRVIDGADSAGIDLISRAGYTHARSFYMMLIDLTDEHAPSPTMPEGLTLRRFEPDHLREYYEVHQDAFEDHWGSHRSPYEEWHREMIERVGSDPAAFWQSAWDGDQMVGVAICRPFGEWDGMGWLSVLGVRRAWRRRGVGDALLHATFSRFHQQGYTRVGLGVDASSLTNAVALYERAGMRVYHRRDVYQRVARTAKQALVENVQVHPNGA